MCLPGEVSAPSHPPSQRAGLTHDQGDIGDLLLGWEQLHTYQAAADNAAMLIPWKRNSGKVLQVKGVQPLLRGQTRAAAALQQIPSPPVPLNSTRASWVGKATWHSGSPGSRDGGATLNTGFNTSSAGWSLLPDFSPYSTSNIVPVTRAANPAWMNGRHRHGAAHGCPAKAGVSGHCHVPVMLPFPARLTSCQGRAINHPWSGARGCGERLEAPAAVRQGTQGSSRAKPCLTNTAQRSQFRRKCGCAKSLCSRAARPRATTTPRYQNSLGKGGRAAHRAVSQAATSSQASEVLRKIIKKQRMWNR